MTAHGTIEGAVEAVKLGAFDYLKKPVDLEELKLLADRARETLAAQAGALLLPPPRRARDAAALRRHRRVAGHPRRCWSRPARSRRWTRRRRCSSSARPAPARAWSPAPSTPRVPRSARPFIEVNCTALPATLMEAELFGHERGAFTDAKESRMGLFEAAEGGFLFLDEVGDVELSLQGKLLKAVEERTVRRVGGIRDRRIDVRILAATNRDLETRRAAGALPPRPLFPPGGDHPAPAAAARAGRRHPAPGAALPRRFNAKYGKAAAADRSPGPRAAAGVSLARQRARAEPRDRAGGALEPGATLDSSMSSTPVPLGDRRRHAGRAGAARRTAAETPEPASRPPGMDLEPWERTMIEQALRECDGNQTRAAQRLGISRDTLRYRLKKYGIQG